LLFQAAASTLTRFGRDPRHLGGDLGITAVLHTWGQSLTQHVHVHCVVTGGALAPDGTHWIPARRGFLFPVRALAKVFRGRYLAGLRQAFDRGALHLTGGLAALADPAAFAAWLHELRQPAWVVYCKPPFAGPDHVLAYLGRYTHRVAISNERLVAVADGHVRFRWRDYADGDRVKVMDLEVGKFLRRFLLHVVPDGFVRIRHFGLLANRRRRAALAQCRALLVQPPAPGLLPESVRDLMLRVTAVDIDRCPVCLRGSLRLVAILPPASRPRTRGEAAPAPPALPFPASRAATTHRFARSPSHARDRVAQDCSASGPSRPRARRASHTAPGSHPPHLLSSLFAASRTR